jgi:hypothetical protein
MTGRSNWENKTAPQLSATERLQRALNRPVNEAIKVNSESPVKEDKKNPVLPGLNPMGVRGSARKAKIDSALD